MAKFLLHFYTAILALGAIALCGWLVTNNMPANGTLILPAGLTVDMPSVSRLGPPDRISPTSIGALILASPVYVDVRTPQWFRTLDVVLTIDEGTQRFHSLGVQVGPGFNYRSLEPVSLALLPNGNRQFLFTVPIRGLYRPGNKTRFSLDVSGDAGRPAIVTMLTITARQ